MGILNLTPDSFSDGIENATINDFLNKARQLINDGATILDIGGESTRPNADIVTLAEEEKRVVPFLEAFRAENPEFPISLDTKKYELAKKCLKFDLSIINDVSFLADERFLGLLRESNAYYVLMHSRGDQRSMMSLTDYPNGLLETMAREFDVKFEVISQNGQSDRVIMDLGFGFAKTKEQCVELIEKLSFWERYQFPKLLALSRKRFLQHYTGENKPIERDKISAELAVPSLLQGFTMIRTHNVKLTKSFISDFKLRCQ